MCPLCQFKVKSEHSDFWEIWREFVAVLLCCFIAYLICISFSVCQLSFAFLAEQLVNHLEFLKYFPLLYFTSHFQTFLSSPSLKRAALPAQQKGGEWACLPFTAWKGCSILVLGLREIEYLVFSGKYLGSRIFRKVPWTVDQQCCSGKVCK